MTGTLTAALLAAGFALQPPGNFHGDEPVARDGERWLALQVDAQGASLVATRVSVRPVHDPVLDGPAGRSGREVGSPLDAQATRAFLRGPGLAAGAVGQARLRVVGGARSPLDTVHAIDFGDSRVRLSVRCGGVRVEQVDGQSQRRCALVLDDGHTMQALGTVLAYRDAAGGQAAWTTEQAPVDVAFAGDLDRDGRLDLLLRWPAAGSGTRAMLLLSSRATQDGLVGEAAVFESTGC